MSNPIQEILDNAERFAEVAKSVFDNVDTNGSGQIERNELKVAMGNIAAEARISPPSDADIDKIISEVDHDGNRTLSLSEFSKLVRGLLESLVSNDGEEEEEGKED